MTANGIVTISWGTSTLGAYATPDTAGDADKVEFASGLETDSQARDLVPDATLSLESATYRITRKRAENPLAGAEAARTPDTGIAGATVIYRFRARSAATSGGLARLRSWASQSNAPNARHRRGRVSLKDTRAPAYSLTADATVGYKIRDLTVNVDYHNRVITGTLELAIDGTPSSLGA